MKLDPWQTSVAVHVAAVKQLAALAGTLETLRLVYHEDVPDKVVRILQACMTALLALLCTNF